jgi:hypothetical protein
MKVNCLVTNVPNLNRTGDDDVRFRIKWSIKLGVRRIPNEIWFHNKRQITWCNRDRNIRNLCRWYMVGKWNIPRNCDSSDPLSKLILLNKIDDTDMHHQWHENERALTLLGIIGRRQDQWYCLWSGITCCVEETTGSHVWWPRPCWGALIKWQLRPPRNKAELAQSAVGATTSPELWLPPPVIKLPLIDHRTGQRWLLSWMNLTKDIGRVQKFGTWE